MPDKVISVRLDDDTIDTLKLHSNARSVFFNKKITYSDLIRECIHEKFGNLDKKAMHSFVKFGSGILFNQGHL